MSISPDHYDMKEMALRHCREFFAQLGISPSKRSPARIEGTSQPETVFKNIEQIAGPFLDFANEYVPTQICRSVNWLSVIFSDPSNRWCVVGHFMITHNRVSGRVELHSTQVSVVVGMGPVAHTRVFHEAPGVPDFSAWSQLYLLWQTVGRIMAAEGTGNK